MGVIRIFANGLELDFEAATLTVKKENNAFITDFKVAASTYPFLIIENSKTLTALGPRNLTSVRKKKIVPVVVLDMGQRYYGQITILSYLNGFRKCDLKYGSDTLSILDKNLLGLLPVVSVIPGETTPVPFTEQAIDIVEGHGHWQEYPLDFVGKIYPEVKYQFPLMEWPDKFFEDAPDEDDPWYGYKGYINLFKRDPGYFVTNGVTVGFDFVDVLNVNVPSPQLFALAILEYAFAGIGYTIAGNFVTSDFARRLLVLSVNNNLCKVPVTILTEDVDWSDFIDSPVDAFFYQDRVINYIPLIAGDYIFNYYIQEPLRPDADFTSYSALVLRQDGDSTNIYSNTNDPNNLHFTGTFTVTVTPEQIGQLIQIKYYWLHDTAEPESVFIRKTQDPKDFYMMHPTINLGRYAPDVTLATFINNLKNLFSLAITFDDVAKVATFNFAQDILTNPAQHIALKSLALEEYNTPDYIGYKLKYANDTDASLLVEPTGTTINSTLESDYIQLIENQFKIVPSTGLTANLAGIEDKDGTGLMLYDPVISTDGSFVIPKTTESFNGATLRFEGMYGIYNVYWKKMLQFLLNGSNVEISGPFTETELRQIDKHQKVYIDNQSYVVLSVETKQTELKNYNAKLELKSINF